VGWEVSVMGILNAGKVFNFIHGGELLIQEVLGWDPLSVFGLIFK